MNTKLLMLLGAGVLGYYIYQQNQKAKRANNPKSEAEIIGEEYVKTAKNYTNAFLMQYDIIIPRAKASRIVRESAFALQEERKRVEQARMDNKTPYYL